MGANFQEDAYHSDVSEGEDIPFDAHLPFHSINEGSSSEYEEESPSKKAPSKMPSSSDKADVFPDSLDEHLNPLTQFFTSDLDKEILASIPKDAPNVNWCRRTKPSGKVKVFAKGVESGETARAAAADRFGRQPPSGHNCRRCQSGGASPFARCKVAVTVSGQLLFKGNCLSCAFHGLQCSNTLLNELPKWIQKYVAEFNGVLQKRKRGKSLTTPKPDTKKLKATDSGTADASLLSNSILTPIQPGSKRPPVDLELYHSPTEHEAHRDDLVKARDTHQKILDVCKRAQWDAYKFEKRIRQLEAQTAKSPIQNAWDESDQEIE